MITIDLFGDDPIVVSSHGDNVRKVSSKEELIHEELQLELVIVPVPKQRNSRRIKRQD